MATPLSDKVTPTALAFTDKEKANISNIARPPANKRLQKQAIKWLQKERLSAEDKEIYALVSKIICRKPNKDHGTQTRRNLYSKGHQKGS